MSSVATKFRTVYQVFFCALISIALVVQFAHGITVSGGMHFSSILSYTGLFISYFTIVSNVLVAIVLGMEANMSLRGVTPSDRFADRFDRLRATAVFCILTTGIIYSMFLKGPGGQGAVQDSIPWINSVFHYIMPTVMTLDWILFRTRKPIPWRSIINWILFTVIYLIYVEVLGLGTHQYPYFFLNPTMFHGYLGVLKASVTFIPFFIVFGAIVVSINKIRMRSGI